MVAIQDEVVAERVRRDDPVLSPIFRDVPDPQLLDLAGSEACDVRASDENRAIERGAHARDGLDQLALPVSFHSSDADDLSRSHGEGHVLHRPMSAVIGDLQALHLQDDRSRPRWFFVHLEPDRAADHHGREPLLGGGSGRDAAYHPTAA